MKICYYTRKGLVNPYNEDGIFIQGLEFTKTGSPQTLFLPGKQGLFAVWDGLGGHHGGDKATAIALRGMANAVVPVLPDCYAIGEILNDIVTDLCEQVALTPSLCGMGASCAGLWLCDNYGLVFNCGDCRVYQKQGENLLKLSHDHSMVQELFDKGFIDAEGMRIHPGRGRLNSAVCACVPIPDIFCSRIELCSGDAFLICSDGLWEALPHQELESILNNTPDSAAIKLTQAYTGSAGQDDYSFIIIQC